jgi:hypothetical protein
MPAIPGGLLGAFMMLGGFFLRGHFHSGPLGFSPGQMYLTFLQLARSLGKTVIPLTVLFLVKVSGVAFMGFVSMPGKNAADHVSERFMILSENSWELSVLLPLFSYSFLRETRSDSCNCLHPEHGLFSEPSPTGCAYYHQCWSPRM